MLMDTMKMKKLEARETMKNALEKINELKNL
jgi:hypothetical protein